MATHYSHDNMLFTAIAENATAIAVSTYFVEASVRVASGSFPGEIGFRHPVVAIVLLAECADQVSIIFEVWMRVYAGGFSVNEFEKRGNDVLVTGF